MHELPGTKLILMTLLEQGRSTTEKRSIEKRYNFIMKAIYGDNAKHYLLKKKKRGGQRKNSKYGIHLDLVLLAMHKAARKKEYPSLTKLAEEFIDKISYDGIKESAIERLRNEYTKRKEELNDPEKRYWIRYGALKNYTDEEGADGEWMNEYEVKVALEGVGWEFWDKFDSSLEEIDFLEDEEEENYKLSY